MEIMKKFPTDTSLNECSLTREVVGHCFTFLLTHHCGDTAWLLNAQCFHCLKHIHKSLCFITLDRIDQGTEYSTATHSITEKVIKEHTSSFYINYRIGKFFFFLTHSPFQLLKSKPYVAVTTGRSSHFLINGRLPPLYHLWIHYIVSA